MSKSTRGGGGGRGAGGRKKTGARASTGSKGQNAPVSFLAVPGELRITAKQKKGGSELDRTYKMALEVTNPEKQLSVRLQDLQTHRCVVTLALHQLVAGEGDGAPEKEDPQGGLVE